MKLFSLALTFLFPIVLFAQVGSKNFIDQNYIEVTGKAEMLIVPNEIYIGIILNEGHNKNNLTIEQLEKQMIEKLQGIGLNTSERLMVRDMVSNLKTYTLSKDKIHQTKNYQLIVSDAQMAAKTFEALAQVGISNMNIEKLDHTRIVEYKNEVKIKAVAAAKEKAQALTKAVGQEVGRAMFIQEQNFFHSYQTANAMEVNSKFSAGKQPDLDFEKIKLEFSVLCRFELK